MWLNRIVLGIALLISAAAAFYSITGLTAIFTGATVAVLIMGLVLEAGKVAVAAWLHEYWKESSKVLRVYLVIAVVVLMAITSMGTFGFLSKSHLESTAGTAVATAQVQMYDDELEILNQDLARIDRSVQSLDQIAGGVAGDDAPRVRRQQRAERTLLQEERTELLAKRTELTAKRTTERRSVVGAEAELGPIKYIAEMIYGADADEAAFDKAVRWMIILLVIVFDPLAIAMLIAAQSGMRIEAKRKMLAPYKAKPGTEFEAGAFYAPYIPALNPNIMPESLTPVEGYDLSEYEEPTYATTDDYLSAQESASEDREIQLDTEKAEVIQEVIEPEVEEIVDPQDGWLSNVKSLRRGSPTVETL